MNTIFTIGYGNRDFKDFLSLLHRYAIEVVCDVRSTPYSVRYELFNREVLEQALKDSAIRYLFLGELLGARPTDPEMYVNGRASYDAMARSSAFRQGIERLEVGMEQYRIAVMCAEKDPIDCHRAVLVGRMLCNDGVSVQHVNSDGEVEPHDKFERRMLQKYNLIQHSLFEVLDESAALAKAYERRGAELAYDVGAAYRARATS